MLDDKYLSVDGGRCLGNDGKVKEWMWEVGISLHLLVVNAPDIGAQHRSSYSVGYKLRTDSMRRKVS